MVFKYPGFTANTVAPPAPQVHARPDLWGLLCDASFQASFFARIDRSAGPDACHPWTGATTWEGYGVLKVRRVYGTTAHRVALALKLGRVLQKGEDSRHASTCTTRRCCNEKHLSPGTRTDNIRDCIEAGRFNLGPKPPKLTEAQVREIRRRYEAGEHAPSLSASMGISLARIYGVVSGRHFRLDDLPLRSSRPFRRQAQAVSQ